jgi:hypothetical protein
VASKLTSSKRGGLLCAGAFSLVAASANAQLTIPADIGVTLSADPSTNLATNQSIHITLAVTNYGPDPAPQVGVVSSNFTNEIGQFVTNPDECFLFLTVVDAFLTAYQFINWDVANVLNMPGSKPLEPGETKTCHFQFALTSQAGPVVPFSFGLPSFFSDINPINDQATVLLQRAPPRVTPAPALSRWHLVALAMLFALCALARIRGAALSRARAPIGSRCCSIFLASMGNCGETDR